MELKSKKIVAFIIVSLVTIFVSRPIDSFDVWWHLNGGLWMLENGRVLDYDLWSFTQTGASWMNISWLFQILIAFSYEFGDLWGLYIFKLICVFVVFSIIFISIKTQRNIISFLLASLIILPFIYAHLHLRPNLLEIIVLLFLVLLSQRPCRLRIVCLGFLALLVLANSHASVIVGSVAFALYVLFGKWDSKVRFKAKAIMALLILSTPYLTPYGFDIFKLLFAHDGSDLIKYYVGEWVQRDVYPLGLWLIFLLALFHVTNNKLRLNITESFLLIFFLFYSFKYQRFELELAVLLVRPFAETIGYGIQKFDDKGKYLSVLISLFFLLIHGLIYSGQLFNLAPSLYADIPSNKFIYPAVTVKQLDNIAVKLNRNIKVLNDYDYGGYIGLFTDSKAEVFIDGRMSTIYPESLLIPPYESDPIILKRLARRYNVDAILLKLDKAFMISVDDPDWQMIAYDPVSVLFIRRSLATEVTVPDIKYNPGLYQSAYVSKDLQVHKEATLNLLALEPENPVALNHMAIFLSGEINSFESRQEVFDYLDKSVALNPRDIFSKATYAYILAATNSNIKLIADDFFKFLPPADKLTSGINLSYDLVYSRALIDLGLSREALKYLYPREKNRRYNMDKLIDVWKLRIIAHNELDEGDKAKNCLAIAYELVNDEDAFEIEGLNNLAKLINEKR